jgi:hypothetical protein
MFDKYVFNLKTFILLAFLVFEVSIIHAQVIDKDVILSVENVNITKYEFEKNLELFKTGFIRTNNSNPTSADIKKWIRGFIDHTYFLADAYQNGFDTLKEVNEKVNGMEHLMLTQPGGLLDEKLAREMLTSDEIENALKNELKKVTASSLDSIRKQVVDSLVRKKKVNVRAQYEIEIERNAQIKINEKVLSQLTGYLQSYWGLHEFDKKILADLLQLNLISYTFESNLKRVSVNQFIDYYNYLPFKRGIEKENDIVHYLRIMVYDDYAYHKAKEYGLTQKSKFILDKENYKKNIIYSLYEKGLKKRINVSEDELKEKYNSEKFKFTQPTDVNVSICYFKDINKAVSAMISLRKVDREVNDLPGLENIEHKNLNYQSPFFPDSIKTLIFALKVKESLKPVFSNGKYIIVVKESESGKRIKSIDEVKSFLVKKVQNEKLIRKMTIDLSRMKSLYSIKNEINYN